MRKWAIFLVFLAGLFALVFGQYELKETYYGPGGPVGASGGSYELWGSAAAQTAVTTVSGGSYNNQQGFYHGEKMYFVHFFAKDVQRAAANDGDSIRIWADSLMVIVHYLSRGIWRVDTIGHGGDIYIAAWVDSVQSGAYNYRYEPVAVYQTGATTCSPGDPCDADFHRWARPSALWGTVTSGTQDDAETVTVSFWEQYRCSVYVEYDPPTSGSTSPYEGGYVDFVKYTQFGMDHTDDDAYDHQDTFDVWCDAGNTYYSSVLEFSDTTTAGWITLNDHIFGNTGGLDKSIIKTIKYQKPYNAVFAQTILWRRYTLFGVPLYPREDTARYINFARDPHHYCGDFSGDVDYGEQDIVLYDDMHSVCDGSDSNCGTWEFWYRIMRYYPDDGGYKRYRGPGHADNPDRFAPGIGFWGNQTTHCESIPIDTWGVLVDTTDSFEVPLHRSDGSHAYTCYNMLANPFYDPTDDTIKVDVTKWRVRKIREAGDIVIDITEAVSDSHWIQNSIWVWRKEGASWHYKPLDISGSSSHQYIYEWEGFWIMVDPSCTDSLHLIMYTERASPVTLLRAARGGTEWFVNLSCQSGDVVDYYNQAGFSSVGEKRFFEPAREMDPPDQQGRMHLYYLKDGEKLAGYFYNTRQDVYVWQVRLDPVEMRGKDFRLFWDLSTVPPDYAVKLKISGETEIDLRTTNEYVLQDVQKPVDMELFVYAVTSPVAATENLVPDKFFLSNAIPNPFNTSATIKFGIPAGEGDFVTVEITDVSGRHIRTLWNRATEPGYYSVVWDGTDDAGNPVPSGNYLCRIVHPKFQKVTHAVLIR